jgi:hypothetical protein
MRFLRNRRKDKLDMGSRGWLKKSQRDRLNETHKRKLVKRIDEEMLKGKKNKLLDEAKRGRIQMLQETYGANTGREHFVHNYCFL